MVNSVIQPLDKGEHSVSALSIGLLNAFHTVGHRILMFWSHLKHTAANYLDFSPLHNFLIK